MFFHICQNMIQINTDVKSMATSLLKTAKINISYYWKLFIL